MPTAHKHTVSMSCLAPPGQHVDLVGDFPDWDHPIAMGEVAPGDYQCSIALAPGVYRYKFRLNHRLWFPDPRASLVDTSNPFHNAILVIGGIEDPFLFAPDRRHVALSERGHLAVQIELIHPVESPIELLVNVPGRHWDSARFFEIASQRGFRILRAELTRAELADPQARAHFRFATHPHLAFDLPLRCLSGHGGAAARDAREGASWRPAATAARKFNVPLTRPRARASGCDVQGERTAEACRLAPPLPLLDEPPSWLASAIFYSVLIDRWHRGRASPPLPKAHTRSAPSGPGTFYGGDFDGLCDRLDELAALGVNALILTPVHPSPSPLRRAAADLLSVDPALGGEAGLRRLVEAARARRIKVVVEAAVTHLSARHPLFARLLREQAHCDYADWFQVRRFPVSERDAQSYAHLAGHPECPALDLTREAPRRYVMRALDALLKCGIDGLLFYGLNEAPADLWRLLRQRLRRQNPRLLLLGQASGDNLAAFSGSAGVDAVHDIRHRESLLAFFGAEAIDAESFCRRVAFDEVRLGPLSPTFFLQALDTVDTPRFLSAALFQARLRLSLTWLFLRPGPICLTYGTELGAGFLDASLAARNAWRDRPPMPDLPGEPTVTGRLISQLSALRRRLRPLREGAFAMRAFAERGLWVERRCGAQIVRAYLNAGRLPIAMPLPPEGARCLLDVNVPANTPENVLPGDSARLFASGLSGLAPVEAVHPWC